MPGLGRYPLGLLRLGVAAYIRPRRAGCRAGGLDIPGQGRCQEHIRRDEDVHASARAGGAHLAQTGGPHHARQRLARRHARVRQKGLRREARLRAVLAEDLVGRDFSAAGPNRAWFADITYVKTSRGWLYAALVMDIWSRRIVGWSMSDRMTAELADGALKMALARRNPPKGAAFTAMA